MLALARQERGPFLVTAGILAEITYMVEQRLGKRALEIFIEDIIGGVYSVHCGEVDFPRVLELVDRYDDLPLGFSDAAVIACAERHGGKVLTLDHRHFGLVAREGTIEVFP